MKQLNYYWRIFATGLCFSTFGIGGLVLTLTLMPLIYLLFRDQSSQRKAARLVVQKAFKFFVKQMQVLGVFEKEIDGAEKLKHIESKVVVANHPCLIDVVMLIAYVPHANCVVKSSLFSNPFIKGVLNCTGYIRNDNPEQLIYDCQQSLSAGDNIIIFPEGTRTEPGATLKFARGAANIAVRCKADYQPVLINVSPTTLTRNEYWYQVPSRKFKLKLKVLPIMHLSSYWEQSNPTLSVRSLTRDSQEYFIKELIRNEY